MDRRKFIKGLALSGSYVLLLEHSLWSAIARADSSGSPTFGPDLGFFDPLQRTALAYLCDFILPDSPALGSVQYIETLLTAFDSDPPKIYAGGPFSGRNDPSGGPNHFQNFVPLNRYQEAAWKLYLYGSDAMPGGFPNDKLLGSTPGLRDLLMKGVTTASFLIPESGLVTHPMAIARIWSLLDSDCQDAIEALTIEACLSAPEYGGNRDQQGWKWVHFPGDVAPYGYSHFDEATQTYSEDPAAPVSTATPGTDSDPMSFSSKVLFHIISAFEDGRTFY